MSTRKILPGSKVRGSESGRPLMALFDLLGRRQAMRILCELWQQSLTFRELQSRCDNASPTLINQRLTELRDAQLIDNVRGEGYSLTKRGISLIESLSPINKWSEEWARLFQE